MGSEQQFRLRWNDHEMNIMNGFENLLQKGDFVDVTLACEGRTLSAHKVVLSSCSSYFRRILKENPCQHPVIILKDVRFDDIKALIDFMYKGEVCVSQDQLATFPDLVQTLEIKRLAEILNAQERSPQSVRINEDCPGHFTENSHRPVWSSPYFRPTTATTAHTAKRCNRVNRTAIENQPNCRRGTEEICVNSNECNYPISIPKNEIIISGDDTNKESTGEISTGSALSGDRDTSQTVACPFQEFEGELDNENFNYSHSGFVKTEPVSPTYVSTNFEPSTSHCIFSTQPSSSEDLGHVNLVDDVPSFSVLDTLPSASANDANMIMKRKSLTIAQKSEIISRHANGESTVKLAREFGIKPPTICCIIKGKTKLQSFRFSHLMDQKRVVDSPVKQVEKVLHSWYLQQRALDNPISGKILKAKALELNSLLKESPDFKASEGWLQKFKNRHEIKLSKQ